MGATSPTTGSPAPGRTPSDAVRVAGVVAGLTILLGVMLTAFALPAANLNPHHVGLGVVGPPSAVTAARQQLESRGDAFDIKTYADADAARTAILERKIYGAVILDPGGVHTLVASAASVSIAATAQGVGAGIASASDVPATVTDIRPFPSDDSRGAGLSAGALPLALGGWIGATVIMLVFHTPGRRMLTAGIFAVVGGLGLTAVLQFGIGTLDGNYWLTSLGAMLGIGATASAVLGLRTLFGGAGLGIAAILLILLGNPLSGLSNAPELLPEPWGAIGQLLPPGATGALIRDLAFFDGHGSLHAVLTLTAWLVGGAVFLALGVARHRNQPDPETPEHEIEEAFSTA
ncbi:SNG1 family protein [Frankia sp. Mgl5]|uniref:SNG1 family protein n=1 Tax=Frankia sp. Mgl5 TaxID=2933793 RepID=UPI00200CB451|nr:SNG1 family protein [Frankia sp. Mgl5]MCK9928853.1 SNG1 family protein [Frankia sp. Mgl5]